MLQNTSSSFYGVSTTNLAGGNSSVMGRSGNTTQQHVSNTKTLMTQVAQNLHLLKLRTLHCAQVPLSHDEQDAFLADSGSDALNRPGVAEELKLIDDTVSHPDPEKATNMLKDQIDSLFRFMYEEYSLRLGADRDAKHESKLPEQRLLKAVEFQRETLDTHRSHTKTQAAKIQTMEKQLTELKVVLTRHDEVHKMQLTGYLKELCVLKEQLYRSYRDKEYVGKSMDLMECLVDDDTGEDVSVDELLMVRRMYRVVEAKMAQLKEKMNQQVQDLKSKSVFIERMQEKSRTQELTVVTLKTDIDSLNRIVLEVESERDLQMKELIAAREGATVLQAKLDIANRKVERLEATKGGVILESDGEFESGSGSGSDYSFTTKEPSGEDSIVPPSLRHQQGRSPRKAKVEMVDVHCQTKSLGRHVSPAKNQRSPATSGIPATQGESPVTMPQDDAAANDDAEDDDGPPYTDDMEDLLDAEELAAKRDAQNQALEAQLKAYLADIDRLTNELAELRHGYVNLEKEHLDTKSRIKAMEDENEDFRARCEAAEMEADNAMTKAAEQTEVLTLEMQSAAQIITALRARNKALMEGYLAMDQRLTSLKSRAGIDDYKKRANEFHLRRAEQVIDEANKSAAEVKAECRAQVVAAELKQEHAEHQLAMAVEDIRSQEILQEQTIATLTERTLKVQDAFEALLGDFESLRSEYMSQTSTMADNQASIALTRLVKKVENTKLGVDPVDRRSSKLGVDPADRRPSAGRLSQGSPVPAARLGSPSGGGRRDTLTTPTKGSRGSTPVGSFRHRFIFEMPEDQSADTPTQVVSLCGQLAALYENNLKKGAVSVLKQLSVSGRDLTAQDRMVLVSHELNNVMSVHFTELFTTFSRLLNLDKELKARAEENKAKAELERAASTRAKLLGAKAKKASGKGGNSPGSASASASASFCASVNSPKRSILVDMENEATDAAAIKKELEQSTNEHFNSVASVQEQQVVLAWEKMKTFTLMEKTLRHLVHDVRALISASEVANLYDDTQVGLPPREDDLGAQADAPPKADLAMDDSTASFSLHIPSAGDAEPIRKESSLPAPGANKQRRASSVLALAGPRASTPVGAGPLPSIQQPRTRQQQQAKSENPAINAMNDGSAPSLRLTTATDGVSTMTTSMTGQPAHGAQAALQDDEQSRALDGQARIPMDADDANCGDFSSVNHHLKELEGRLGGGAGNSSDGSAAAVPPWKLHKEAMKKQQQAQPQGVEQTPPRHSGSQPPARGSLRIRK